MLLTLLLGIFTIVELNCENLFDCKHDSLKQDEAYMPDGMYHWTPARYWKKINNIGQEIISCGIQDDMTFLMPDLIALCEVENDSVLFDLTRRSLLRNAQYEYIITNSPDLRGIDVALIYSPFTFLPISTYSLRISPLEGMRPTRDILYVKGHTADNDTLHVFAVHTPSRSGGEMETRPNRKLVTDRLMMAVDSIRTTEPNANIIIAGDFNDYNNDPSLITLYNHNLHDVSANAHSTNGSRGTYKYHGEWGSLDHIFITDGLLANVERCIINDAIFLLQNDEEYGGKRPFRTFNGIKYSPGFSDHLPLVLTFRK